jgi:hypothetical protein
LLKSRHPPTRRSGPVPSSRLSDPYLLSPESRRGQPSHRAFRGCVSVHACYGLPTCRRPEAVFVSQAPTISGSPWPLGSLRGRDDPYRDRTSTCWNNGPLQGERGAAHDNRDYDDLSTLRRPLDQDPLRGQTMSLTVNHARPLIAAQRARDAVFLLTCLMTTLGARFIHLAIVMTGMCHRFVEALYPWGWRCGANRCWSATATRPVELVLDHDRRIVQNRRRPNNDTLRF